MAQRRQARAEAREIRMRELERQQIELEQNADRAFDMQSSSSVDPIARSRLAAIGRTGNNTSTSRRSSEDSLEEEGRSLRDMRQEIKVRIVIHIRITLLRAVTYHYSVLEVREVRLQSISQFP